VCWDDDKEIVARVAVNTADGLFAATMLMEVED
jgi:hypothetical protein